MNVEAHIFLHSTLGDMTWRILVSHGVTRLSLNWKIKNAPFPQSTIKKLRPWITIDSALAHCVLFGSSSQVMKQLCVLYKQTESHSLSSVAFQWMQINSTCFGAKYRISKLTVSAKLLCSGIAAPLNRTPALPHPRMGRAGETCRTDRCAQSFSGGCTSCEIPFMKLALFVTSPQTTVKEKSLPPQKWRGNILSWREGKSPKIGCRTWNIPRVALLQQRKLSSFFLIPPLFLSEMSLVLPFPAVDLCHMLYSLFTSSCRL